MSISVRRKEWQLSGDSGAKSRLSAVLGATSKRIQGEFEEIRVAMDHNGLVGDDGEEVVREFLRSILPSAVGVTTGEVVDSLGGTSRQADVILYAADQTPMLFAGINRSKHSVPVEGVLAVIEVKTKLRSGDVETCIRNCQSIKQLSREAYFPLPSLRQYEMYGTFWDDMPILYSVFAPSADGLYAAKFNELQQSIPVDQRVDMVCVLDRGLNINVSARRAADSARTESNTSTRALVNGGMAEVPTNRALLLWYIRLASEVMVASTRPIDLAAYAEDDLQFEARIPLVDYRDATPDAVRASAVQRGYDPAIAEAWLSGEGVSFRQFYEMLRGPGMVLVPEGGGSGGHPVQALVEGAQHLDFETWATILDLPTEDSE